MSVELAFKLPDWDDRVSYHQLLQKRSQTLMDIYDTLTALELVGKFKTHISSEHILVIFDDPTSALLFKLTYSDGIRSKL